MPRATILADALLLILLLPLFHAWLVFPGLFWFCFFVDVAHTYTASKTPKWGKMGSLSPSVNKFFASFSLETFFGK